MLRRLKGAAALPLFVLGATAAIIFASRPSHLAGVDFERVPYSFPGWWGRGVEVDPVAVEILQPDAIVMRRYDDAQGRACLLCIVYHQNNKYGAHDVPVCYTSVGYAKKALDRQTLPAGAAGLTVNRLVAGKPQDTRVVYYWFTTGERDFADAGLFRRAQMISGLVSNRSHGALIRIETQAEGGDLHGAEARLGDLTARIVESLPAAFAAGGGVGDDPGSRP